MGENTIVICGHLHELVQDAFDDEGSDTVVSPPNKWLGKLPNRAPEASRIVSIDNTLYDITREQIFLFTDSNESLKKLAAED